MEKKKLITWICDECGEKCGKRKCGVATWHENTCDICGKRTYVTEPRDFGGIDTNRVSEMLSQEQPKKEKTIKDVLNEGYKMMAKDEAKMKDKVAMETYRQATGGERNGALITINGEMGGKNIKVLVFIDATHSLVLEKDETGIYAITDNGDGYAYKISENEYKRLSKLTEEKK